MNENSNSPIKSQFIKSNLKKCLNFLQNFDIFGITFNFRIETNEKFQSSFGGLWLIAFLFLSIILYIYTLMNYFSNPSYVSYFYETPLNFSILEDNLHFNTEKFDFGFFIKNKKINFPQNTFEIKGYYNYLNSTTNYTYSRIELKNKKCNGYYFKTEIKSQNTSNRTDTKLNSMTCFDTSKYLIGGSEFDDKYSYFVFEIQINKNLNSTYILELIDQSPPEYEFLYSELTVKNDDYSMYELRPNYLYNGFEVGARKTIDIYVTRCIYEQDLGILFTNKQTYAYAKYESGLFRTRKIDTEKESIIIGSVNIRASNLSKINQKYIVKIITVMQLQWTNLLNYLIVFKIVATMVNIRLAKPYLINKIFNVEKKFIEEIKNNIKLVNLKNDKNNKEENNKDENFNVFTLENNLNFTKKNFDWNNFTNNNEFSIRKYSSSKNLDKNKSNNNNPKNNFENDLLYCSSNQNNINKNSIKVELNNQFYEVNNIKEEREKGSNQSLNDNSNNCSIINIVNDEKKEENLKYKIEKKNIFDINENNYEDFNKILDLTYFMKKMEEVELLKFLLFDQESICFFNLLVGKIKLFDKADNEIKDREFQKLFIKNYENLKNSSKNNFAEKKILLLFENFIIKS